MNYQSFNLKEPSEIKDFIERNQNIRIMLNEVKPKLNKYFPESKLTLELCDNLKWSDDIKLLINIDVDETMFYNGLINNLNNIYDNISHLREDVSNDIVLFPKLISETLYSQNINPDRLCNYIARECYFNSENKGVKIVKEIRIREIPKKQKINEIIQYCSTHNKPHITDIVNDLSLDLVETDEIIDDLFEKGINLNVRY